jgi:hypothetical protein
VSWDIPPSKSSWINMRGQQVCTNLTRQLTARSVL